MTKAEICGIVAMQKLGAVMKKYACAVALGLCTMATALQGAAQTQAPAEAPTQVWDLEVEDSHCTITTGDKNTPGLAVWMIPGQPDPELYLINAPNVVHVSPFNSPKLTVVLEPNGETFQAHAYAGPKQNMLGLGGLPYNFPAAFAHAEQVRVVGGAKPVSVTVRGTDKAMAAIQQCIDEALPGWGIDPKLLAGLRKPVTTIDDHPVVTGDDYPREALDKNIQGSVVIRLHVDSKGLVQDCAVMVSSGSKLLDNPTCILALAKGKFDPAIGADGKPTDAPRIMRVEWSIMQ